MSHQSLQKLIDFLLFEMVDTERMLNVIGLHSKSEEDMLVIDGTRYLAEDIIFSRVEVEATECHFVTIHHNSGKLKK